MQALRRQTQNKPEAFRRRLRSVVATHPIVVMMVMMADPTRDPDDHAAVVMVMMTEVAAMMMVVMANPDINLRHLHVGFVLGRSRGVGGLGRLQCSKRVRNRIEQLGKRPGGRHAAGVLRRGRGGLRAADRG